MPEPDQVKWEMPEWLKPYRKLVESGCGGNSAETLMNNKGANYFNNPVLCELIGMCSAKVNMLTTMHKLKLLPTMEDSDLEGIIARGTK
jgi:hypothetical protein